MKKLIWVSRTDFVGYELQDVIEGRYGNGDT